MVDAGDKHLVHLVVPDLTKSFARAGQMGVKTSELLETVKIDISATFTDWRIDEPLPAETFGFKPPERAKRVDAFFSFGKEKEKLLGKEAPNFKLRVLDGDQIELKNHFGKHIVVLGFWATWCGPCRRALPIIAELTNQYGQKGVVFYAINQGEEPEVIRRFLEEKKFNCKVALDSDEKVGELYEVAGIPKTIIIDKDGIIQSIHSGFLPNLKSQLRKELDTLVQGKKLVDQQEKRKSEKK